MEPGGESELLGQDPERGADVPRWLMPLQNCKALFKRSAQTGGERPPCARACRCKLAVGCVALCRVAGNGKTAWQAGQNARHSGARACCVALAPPPAGARWTASKRLLIGLENQGLIEGSGPAAGTPAVPYQDGKETTLQIWRSKDVLTSWWTLVRDPRRGMTAGGG